MKHRIFCCTRKRTGSRGSHTRLCCQLYAHYILEIFVENSRNSRRRESFRFQRRAEIKRSIPLEPGLNMHFPPKIRQFLPSCDNCVIKNGRKQVKKFGQPWLILTVQYLVCISIADIFVCVSGQRTSYLFLSFFFYCPPKKIRPGKAEKNEKASSLYRLRQLTITKKMKRCVPLRWNVAEKPWGMRLKFVLSQLRTCRHESENMFVFFKS